MKPFNESSVAAVFEAYPESVRGKLLKLRELIFQAAVQTPGVGAIEETLKWGQPSYLTSETKSGTTIRIDALSSEPGCYGIYFHCQTTLVETFRNEFGDKFRYEGNRALIFDANEAVPEKALLECISMALTYHLRKKGTGVPIGKRIHENER
ncbi:DUF1801 domain-containing protein [Rubellicoccus peritrichatus]|uniref:DUF1801 domain-containing protein n=1 Tax=Rubellicoccus peritrichatus TaxID=3080537 RepID=A0AAQ3QUG1_9BACT|nr:DUF1801 domain-containing protein [Puniceicoccus sp. CR14]WOO39677.1 DUF1801 domain-containing protein [Puniceicoccus sp. CR14]